MVDTASFGAQLRLFLRDIRIEHSLFAMPFAWIGAVVAAHGWPSFAQLAWITLAVAGARTAAMAANRLLDKDLDAKNPRTARRPLASGSLAPALMIGAVAGGIVLLLVAAWNLNPLCVKLLPIAALGILVYPLCKRFTWSVHFVLGAVDGFAPLGAFIGVAGTAALPAALPGYLLFAAVTVWVAGFDIAYALMDYDVDRAQGIRSIPAAFGRAAAPRLLLGLHALMLVLLGLAGPAAHAGRIYVLGLVAAAALLVYEERLLRTSENVFVLNERIFNANMAFSVIFLLTTSASYL